MGSRQDALQLLEFVKTPISTASRLIREVRISVAQKVSSNPWLHLISVISDRARRGVYTYFLNLAGPLPAGQRTLRSIHHGLPRSLPHFSPQIYCLSLTAIRFEKLDDLMHLLWEMPSLCMVECEGLTWGSLPTMTTPPRRKSINTSQQVDPTITMRQCGPCSLEASLWLSTCLRPRQYPFFSSDDFTRALTLVRAIQKGAGDAVDSWLNRDSFGECESVSILFFLPHHHVSEIIWGLSQYIRFCDNSVYKNAPPPSNSREWSIDTVAMDTRGLYLDRLQSEIGWNLNSLGEILAAFPALKRVIVGCESREAMMWFEEEVAAVPRLSDSGMLRYALWDPTGRMWLRASPSSDVTQRMSFCPWQHSVTDSL